MGTSVAIGADSKIGDNVIIFFQCKIGQHVRIKRGVTLGAYSQIGDDSSVGCVGKV